MVLFVNACVREQSRTKQLADRVLAQKKDVQEIRLGGIDFPLADQTFLRKRDELIAKKQWDDPMLAWAKQFAMADEIVIAAPFWDLSFPACLKQYIEQINVIGLTFGYTADGLPMGLCKASKLTYITTAGGTYYPAQYGFGYIQDLAHHFYGIQDVRLVVAKGLDLVGANQEAILQAAFEQVIKEGNI